MKGFASIFLLSLLMGAATAQAQWWPPEINFDGDGRPDKFSFQGPWIVTNLGTGGTWTTRLPDGYDPSLGSWRVEDFDHDGKTDLIHDTGRGVQRWRSLGNGRFEVPAGLETGAAMTQPGQGTSIQTWTPDCLCKRGSEWVGHFDQNAVGAPPSIGDVMILAGSDQKTCLSKRCENGTGLTSGSKKVKVTRVFIRPDRSQVFGWSVFGEEVP
jgi:hypothetical protein